MSVSPPHPTSQPRLTSFADPLTWLLPNGLLFMQGSWLTTLMNYTDSSETRLPNMTRAQRTYPGSGSTAMLTLTAANNYEPTLLFCGGMDPVRDE